MLNFLRKIIPETSPIRLLYHKLKAVIAAIMYGFPARKMIVIGVTGTKGKTTTVNLIAKILETSGALVGMASTINFQVLDKKWNNNTKQTTQSPFALQRLLKMMADSGCKYAVLEVSSHALTQSRVWGINFDCAAYTNVSPDDHLEYHGGFANYLAAKGELFNKVSKGRKKFGVSKVMILNQEDQNYAYFDQFIADRKVTYGIKDGTVSTTALKLGSHISEFTMKVPNNAVPVSLKLPGDFNVKNALCAAATCMAYGVSVEDIKRGLDAAATVPGRYDAVDEGQETTVVVDYAHTVDSLNKLLTMYRGLTPGKLFAVFGATGGGRDIGKRPKMGEVADRLADYVILTDDDPYSDDEIKIIDQIAAGVKRVEGEKFWKIPDRYEAIRFALSMSGKGDSVVVAGKGAEEVMKVRGKTIEWNDKKVCAEILHRTLNVEIE